MKFNDDHLGFLVNKLTSFSLEEVTLDELEML
jgi:hypothetical protein